MSERKYLYTATFNPNKKNIVEIGELKVELPTMPKLSEMRNYGLPKHEQKFQYEVIPPQYYRWKKGSDEKERFIDLMFHLRDNGEWWLINGKPVYITGVAWFFFNFWHLQEGNLPKFRMEAVEYFWVEDWVYRNPFIMGMAIVKRRQEGISAKINCSIYARTTRLKYAHAGMMGDNDDRSKANIQKTWIAHNKMPDFFKPKIKGTNKSPRGLFFTLPEDKQSLKKLIDNKDDAEFEGLESSIIQEASVLGAFDGDRLHQFYMDEFGKIWRFNPNEQLNKIRPFLESIKGDGSFSGKAIFGSTVEDSSENAIQIEKIMSYMAQMWQDSNPNKLNALGATKNGLVRYFRDCISTTNIIDEFGFPIKEKAAQMWEMKVKEFEDAKDYKGLSSFRRMNPRYIEDALSMTTQGCILFPHLLNKKIASIRLGQDMNGNEQPPLAKRGNLIWTDSSWTAVRWMHDPNGKWSISQHPIEPNAKRIRNGRAAPANGKTYCMALDPTDVAGATSKEADLSKTGMVVKRKFDRSAESPDIEFYTHEGVERIRNPEKMVTNRVVCTYHHRNDDPYDNFVDALKTAVYYGAPILVEKNSPYTYNRLNEDYPNYLANRPQDGTKVMARKGVRTRVVPEKGIRTTTANKGTYTDVTVSYFHDYIPTIEHLDLLTDALNFNGLNLTKCDLIAAFALTELQDQDSRNKQVVETSVSWETNVFSGVPNY